MCVPDVSGIDPHLASFLNQQSFQEIIFFQMTFKSFPSRFSLDLSTFHPFVTKEHSSRTKKFDIYDRVQELQHSELYGENSFDIAMPGTGCMVEIASLSVKFGTLLNKGSFIVIQVF
jgi:hypothetical protein